jgi:hypothetical protein
VAKSQERATPQHPDLLAAVVLHTLVSRGAAGLTTTEIARACERDPDDPGEAREIAAALEILVRDDLALREAETYRPTRAAIRAAELSF